MAGQKFLQNVNGDLTEVIAEQVGGAGKGNLIPALDSTGRLASTMMPVGIGDDAGMLMASEIIASGNYVNVWDDAGVAKVRNADASVNGKEANGFVLNGGIIGDTLKVYFEGSNTALTLLTPGMKYFLSDTTPGKVQLAVPTAAGHIIQSIGVAISATTINFEGQPVIVLA